MEGFGGAPLQEWADLLGDEAAAAGAFFNALPEGLNHHNYETNALGLRRRRFAFDGTELHALAYRCRWDDLVDRLGALPRPSHDAFAAERSTGFTFLHRAYANDGQTSFPPSAFVRRILADFPALARTPTDSGELPLHVACDSCRNISEADERRAVEDLAEAHPDAASTVDGFQRETPLVLAAGADWLVRAMLRVKPMAASVRTGSGILPVAINLRHTETVRLMLEAYPDAAFQVPVYPGRVLLLAHALREGAPFEVVRSIMDVAGWAQFSIVDETNPLFVFWRRMRLIGWGHLEPGGDNWRKAELLTRAAQADSVNEEDFNATPLLHAAAGTYCPWQYLEMVARHYPEQLTQKDRRGRVPLAVAAETRNDVFSFYPKLVNMDIPGLEAMHETQREPSEGKSSGPIDILLRLHPMAARIPENSGRAPLFIAIANGKEWDMGVQHLLEAAPEALMSRDVKTHLYPFMLAAAGDRVSVNTVYQLLLACPEALAAGCCPGL